LIWAEQLINSLTAVLPYQSDELRRVLAPIAKIDTADSNATLLELGAAFERLRQFEPELHSREQLIADKFLKPYFLRYLSDTIGELRAAAAMATLLRELGTQLDANPNNLSLADLQKLAPSERSQLLASLRLLDLEFRQHIYGPVSTLEEIAGREILHEKVAAFAASVSTSSTLP
jgi:hypothetical protein